jgi:cobalt-zinc-cadmium efflux system membrane fusion protein
MKALLSLAVIGLVWACQAPTEPDKKGHVDEPAEHRDEHIGEDHAEPRDGIITLTPEAQRLAGITVEEVGRRSLRRELRVPGTIRANENRLAHVSPRVQGRLIEVTAGLGARVKLGDTLAVIDSQELGHAQSDFLTARAKLEVAEKAYERARTLLEGKVIGTGEVQRREGDHLAARAEAQAAEDRLRLLGLTDADIADLGGQRTIRSRVPITAPLAGTVIQRHATPGELAEPGTPLFTIADLSTLWGIADVPERDLARVANGFDARVVVSAYPDEMFPGTVSYIADTLDPASRTAKVRVEIANARGTLKPEMFATFTILTDETDQIFSVRERAVQRDGGKTIVFVAREGGFEKRPVELGPKLQGYYPVRSGLQPGEHVVTQGAFVLKSESERGQMEEGHGH